MSSNPFRRFELAPANSVAGGKKIAAVARIPGSMEIWWIAPNGSVQAAFWYEGQVGWRRYELAPAGSARSTGGITAVSRIPTSMEVWWVGSDGSVQAAYWYEGGQWSRYGLAPAGSASTQGGIAAVSRVPHSMEVWWVAPNGSVQDAFWYDGGQWSRFELAPPGSAAPTGRIAAVARIPTSMEVWWVGPNGSVQDAYWYEGGQWSRYELAPASSASAAGGIAAVSRVRNSMEIWWVAPNGSVQDAFWYEGQDGWRRFELAPAGSAAPTSGIAAVSRIANSIEIWWVGPNGSVQDAFWYEAMPGWQRYELAPAGSASAAGCVGAVSRVPASMEVWWAGGNGSVQDAYWYERGPLEFNGQIVSGGLAALGGSYKVTVYPDGAVRWEGEATNSGIDSYDFGISALIKTASGRGIALARTGSIPNRVPIVGSTIRRSWNELQPPNPVIAAHFDEFAGAAFTTTLEYESGIGGALETVIAWLIRFGVGTAIGPAGGAVVFIGVGVGSLAGTGSLVPGVRIVGNLLWLAGPANTLFALAAEGIAALGGRTRKLTQEEYDWANAEVFLGALPPRDRIVLTDTIGGGDRAFVFPRFDGKITVNMGPAAFADPRNYPGVGGRTFIHELVHACQIQHTRMDLALLADAFASKVCEATGGNPYTYGPAGFDYTSLNLEQQAQVVGDWFGGVVPAGTNQTGIPKDINSPYFRYIQENVRVGRF